MRNRFSSLVLALGLLASSGLAATAAAQDRGTITGRVTDQATGLALAGAQVVIANTSQGTLTDNEGRYRLPGIAAGQRLVEIVMIGYERGGKQVVVPAGGTVTADFALGLAAISLNEVVVTATGAQQRKAVANAISRIDAGRAMEERAISSVSELLAGRAAGVNVLQSSGTLGAGARIRIRGSNSVSLSNEPIVILDGARIYNAANALSVGTGGQSTSRINDLNPEDIESIEIVKGPSAATLYGTDAANGVVLITTKKGRSGSPRWSAYVEGGKLEDDLDYPLNYRGKRAPTGTQQPFQAANCFAFQVSLGQCTQSTILAYQPLIDKSVSPFKDGATRTYGINVTGGGDMANYFLSFDLTDQQGVFTIPDSIRGARVAAGQEVFEWQDEPNSLRRASLRANLGAQIADGFSLNAAVGYVAIDNRLPQNDNNALGIVPSGLLGQFAPELGSHGYGFLTPDKVFAIETDQEIDRYTTSLQANWQPPRFSWLSGRATLGLDQTHRHDNQFSPVGAIVEFGPVRASGLRTSNRILVQAWTGDASATGSFTLPMDVTSRTTIGAQYFKNNFRGTFANAEGLTPGTKSVGASSKQFAAEETTESITAGVFGEQQFGWRERAFLTLGLRADDNSAFGQDFDLTWYPKVGASYVLVDPDRSEPVFFVDQLRLRGAWGASGVAPGASDALRFFRAATARVAASPGGSAADVPGVTFGAVGNIELKPERSAEVELGLDAGLLDGRLGVEFTFYNKETEDALIERTLPPSLGVSRTRFENIGSVRNTGFELAVHGTLINRRKLTWELGATGSHNDNELIELGEGIEPIIFGNQRHQEGFPLGGYWDNPITFEDLNGDGMITVNELTRGDTAVFVGNVFPANEMSLNTSFTLFEVLRVSGLLDHRGDFRNYNLTEEFRCSFLTCIGLNDPSASLFEQARAVNRALLGGRRSTEPFIEDASFWKLRELSFTLLIPDRWARRLGADRANLVLTGRNLKTWTDYAGLDPEINQIGQSNFSQREFLTHPPSRTWLARVNLSF